MLPSQVTQDGGRSWPLGLTYSGYLGIPRFSFGSQGKALFQTSELLVPAYSHIRPLPGMALEADGSSRWLLGWERGKCHPGIHRAGCQLTAHVQLLVLEGHGIWGGKAGGGWRVRCRGWGGWDLSNGEVELASMDAALQQGTWGCGCQCSANEGSESEGSIRASQSPLSLLLGHSSIEAASLSGQRRPCQLSSLVVYLPCLCLGSLSYRVRDIIHTERATVRAREGP